MEQTIVAQASASGKAGIGIVRLSGGKSLMIAKQMLHLSPKPRYAHYGGFFNQDGELIDKGVAIFYPRPHSFTGEDVLELQAHGSEVVLDQLIDVALSLGAVLAKPGEFSKRAVLNDKMDLAQAEAVADLIASHSKQAAQSALRSLTGVFSTKINNLVDALIRLRVEVEALIDFGDEDIEHSQIDKIGADLTTIRRQLNAILASAKSGALLREGLQIAIIGKPNAGKSSLLNCLTKQDSAIVTDIAGTTRDVVREWVEINGIVMHILDTAGLRKNASDIELLGIDKAYQAIRQADIIVWVYDMGSKGFDLSLLPDKVDKDKVLLVANKIDLCNKKANIGTNYNMTEVSLSTKTKEGLALFKQALLEKAGLKQLGQHTILARKRHLLALNEANDFIISASEQLSLSSIDLLAEDLSQCANTLGSITGRFSNEDLLSKIFSEFCIGK